MDIYAQHAHNRNHTIGVQPHDFMITALKYWFHFGVAPPAILEKVSQLEATYGYTIRKTNALGETVVSEMFLMHCRAAMVWTHLSD